MRAAYDTDVFAWANEQVALLRAGRLSELDGEHIAAEIEEIGKGEMKALRSAIRYVLELLIKMRFSPATDLRGAWKVSIAKQRVAIADLLDDSPSLRSQMEDLFAHSWKNARKFAILGMEKYGKFPDPPDENPFTLGQVLDEDFYP